MNLSTFHFSLALISGHTDSRHSQVIQVTFNMKLHKYVSCNTNKLLICYLPCSGGKWSFKKYGSSRIFQSNFSGLAGGFFSCTTSESLTSFAWLRQSWASKKRYNFNQSCCLAKSIILIFLIILDFQCAFLTHFLFTIRLHSFFVFYLTDNVKCHLLVHKDYSVDTLEHFLYSTLRNLQLCAYVPGSIQFLLCY